MKKAVLILAALLLVSSFVFAEDAGVKIGAWGRGLFVPVMGGSTITSDVAVSWGGPNRIGFTVSGTSANIGFQADLTADKGGPGFGDQQKVWVKPLDMLTLQLGTIFDDTLRGGAGAYGAWNWIRYAGMTGDDVVFARVGTKGQRNFEVAVAPIEGLYVFAGLGGSPDIRGNTLGTWGQTLLNGQYGAGYTIAGIGTVRAQYIGLSEDTAAINAAFKLTAVDKLSLDVGGSFNLGIFSPGIDAIDKAGNNTQFGLGVSYGLDTLTLNASANVTIMKTGDPKMEFGAGADYGLGDNVSVGGDVRYLNKVASGFDNGEVGAMVNITKGFSNGLIGLGVEISTGNFSVSINKANAGDVVWMVPVRFEYFF